MARSEAQIQPHNIYEIKANPTNVHWGYFSAAVKPALTVDSGDVVIIEDVPRLDPSEAERAGFAASEIPEDYRAIYREVKDRGPGPHIMVGPVYVNGAEPGDVLEVQILEVELAYSYGYNRQRPSTGALPDDFTRFWQRVIPSTGTRRQLTWLKGLLSPSTNRSLARWA
jgi:acetamidase/formamidase